MYEKTRKEGFEIKCVEESETMKWFCDTLNNVKKELLSSAMTETYVMCHCVISENIHTSTPQMVF